TLPAHLHTSRPRRRRHPDRSTADPASNPTPTTLGGSPSHAIVFRKLRTNQFTTGLWCRRPRHLTVSTLLVTLRARPVLPHLAHRSDPVRTDRQKGQDICSTHYGDP